MKRKTLLAALASALAAAAAAAAFAAETAPNDAQAIERATVTLPQAVAAAEQHVGGKAARAEFEHSKSFGWIYDVEVVAGAKVFDVKVDAKMGQVLASTLDEVDRDAQRDADD